MILLIIMLLLGGGGATDETTEETTPGGGTVVSFPAVTVFDTLLKQNLVSPKTTSCGGINVGSSASLPLIYGVDIRIMETVNGSGDSAMVFTASGDGTLTIEATGGTTGCSYGSSLVSLLYWEKSGNSPKFDLSGISAIGLTVISSSGVTGCRFRDGAGTAAPETLTPTPPWMVFTQPGWSAATARMSLTDCDFAVGAKLVLGGPFTVP
jgi:hypothetical protein